jgi:hypothetical protein
MFVTQPSFWGSFISVGLFFAISTYGYIGMQWQGYFKNASGDRVERKNNPKEFKAAAKFALFIMCLTGFGLIILVLSKYTCLITCFQSQ